MHFLFTVTISSAVSGFFTHYLPPSLNKIKDHQWRHRSPSPQDTQSKKCPQAWPLATRAAEGPPGRGCSEEKCYPPLHAHGLEGWWGPWSRAKIQPLWVSCTLVSQCSQISSESSDTKSSAGCTFSIATATFFKNLMGRNINISKQKMHALPHSSHSTEDNLQFLEIRHDTAIKICQMEFRPHSQLWHV